MPTTEFAEATRVSTSFLASAERRCLRWIAARMPPNINSDHLTALALFAMLMTGASYWMARATPLGLISAVVWLAVNWFGDSLDGTLARVRGHQRPRYGFYVDHIVDAFGALFVVAGLGLSGYMGPLVATGVLVAYFLLSIEVFLATYCRGHFRLSFWKFGPTELRLLLCGGTLVLLVHPIAVLWGRSYRLFDVGGVVAVAALVVTTVVSAVQNTRALFKAEPLPRAEGSRPATQASPRDDNSKMKALA
jgi:phosphatidylglycerophosphate synthase